MTTQELLTPVFSQREGMDHPRLMRLAVVLSDWTNAKFEVSSYEIFADGCLVTHFEDGGVQTFRPGEWIDVHRSRPSRDVGPGNTTLGMPRSE